MDNFTTTALERRQIAAAKEATLNSASVGVLGLRGRYVPSDPQTTGMDTGTVYLYRDTVKQRDVAAVGGLDTSASATQSQEAYVDRDETTLCILAVPSHITPSDLLGWLGHETLHHVMNVRLVKTARSDRYMVLLKFRETGAARRWKHEWSGKMFKDTSPENCHVVFVESINFETPTSTRDPESFPHMSNDPFVPLPKQPPGHALTTSLRAIDRQPTFASVASKAAQQQTQQLELPTCPVCLERMDDTTGLATILCQHVFHCACLQKWQGNGCPVCRYTQEEHLTKSYSSSEEDACRVCGLTDNLWICLICGHLGCGRYDDQHAFAHFEQTTHAFAMDIKTQAIWDYVNDEWVHRLIQNKADGKLNEMTQASGAQGLHKDKEARLYKDQLEDMSFEYASLLKGQLDSQRCFFEDQLDGALDKAAQATAAADQATAASLKANERLEAMQASHQILLNETLHGLEKAKERAERRAEKFEQLARKMEKDWKEKDVMSDSLMERVNHLEKQLQEATVKTRNLEEQNRDLSFYISGMEKLKDQGADVQEGRLEVGEAPTKGRKKKGKGKG